MNIHEYYHWNYFVREHVNINFNHQTPRLPWSPRLPVRGPGEEQDFIAVAQGDGRIA